jgi:glycosyltransferase involved in cell wall biosynthesis
MVPVRETIHSGQVSVVIPYFNLPDLLPETLDSVAASHVQPCEILIINDGSTDDRSAVALEAASRLPRVRVINQSNQGLAAARNAGAREAQGEYLCFIDADDAIEPGYLGRCQQVLSQYDNVGFVYSWVQWFESTDEVWPAWQAELPYLGAHNMLAAFAVVRRQVFLDHGYNQSAVEYSLEDWEGWLAIYEAGWLGVCIPEPLVRYRIRSGSMMRSFKVEQTHHLYRVIADLHSRVYSSYGHELFLLQNANGPAHLWNNPAKAAPAGPEEALANVSAERDRIWEELKVLAKAWEDHVNYIRQLEQRLDNSAAPTDWGALLKQQSDERAAAEERNRQLLALVAKRVQTASDWDSYVGYKLVRSIKTLPGVQRILARRSVQRWATKLLKL